MYSLEIKAQAMKQLMKLPTRDRERVLQDVALLRENPWVGKQLEGELKGLRALRVWPLRIIYAVDHGTITVTVLRIGHRKNVYR